MTFISMSWLRRSGLGSESGLRCGIICIQKQNKVSGYKLDQHISLIMKHNKRNMWTFFGSNKLFSSNAFSDVRTVFVDPIRFEFANPLREILRFTWLFPMFATWTSQLQQGGDISSESNIVTIVTGKNSIKTKIDKKACHTNMLL